MKEHHNSGFELLRKFIEEEKPIKMSVIVSDVTNGDIIAMDSFPKYDNNNPAVPIITKISMG